MRLKTNAIGKLHYWMENTEVWASDHVKRTLSECARLSYGRRLGAFWDVKDSGDVVGMRERASQLCREQAFIIDTVFYCMRWCCDVDVDVCVRLL